MSSVIRKEMFLGLNQEFQSLAGIHTLVVDDAVNIEDVIDLFDGKAPAF